MAADARLNESPLNGPNGPTRRYGCNQVNKCGMFADGNQESELPLVVCAGVCRGYGTCKVYVIGGKISKTLVR